MSEAAPSVSSASEPYPAAGLPATGSLVVRMDVTNRCNLACIQCTLAQTRETLREPAGLMPVETFRRIASEVFPYAKMVQLSCEAEPMMHPRFLEILAVVAEHRQTAFIATTNATLMPERTVQAIFDSGLCGLNISIDGATSETYAAIRRRGRFDKVAESIGRINRVKAKLGRGPRDAPRLQVNYTLMRSTLEELPRMVDYCIEWGVDRLTLQHVYGLEFTGLHDQSLALQPERSDAVLAQCRARCEAAGILTTFPPPFLAPSAAETPLGTPEDQGTAPSCLAPWQMLRIRWNGGVQPCDLWGEGVIGDLSTHSFEQIWTSPEYVALRDGHLRREPGHPKCRACSMVTTDNLEGRTKRTPLALTREAPPEAAARPPILGGLARLPTAAERRLRSALTAARRLVGCCLRSIRRAARG